MQQLWSLGSKGLGSKIDPNTTGTDLTVGLSDELLLQILKRLPSSPYPYSLVCKRWLRLHSVLRQSLKLQDWSFLQSGRMKVRFPNLIAVDLTGACVSVCRFGQAILLTHSNITIPLSPDFLDIFPVEKCVEEQQISLKAFDKGLKMLSEGYPDLQRLSVMNVAIAVTWNHHSAIKSLDQKARQTRTEVSNTDGSDPLHKIDTMFENGLSLVAINCSMLQELELDKCTDEALTVISACRNLQIVRLVGSVSESALGTFTDVGLTTLAHNCSRLVRLELAGCEASYDGIAALGRCCIMLEELTVSTQGFGGGWLAALTHCTCLKTLRLQNCKDLDVDPGLSEHLGYCHTLECLQMVRCHIRDRRSFAALLTVCWKVRELEFLDCWGLEDEMFFLTIRCRRIKRISLEGCSLLTTAGLEMVLLTWKDLQRLRLIFCSKINSAEISAAFADCLGSLKEFIWRPDLGSVLAGTGLGQRRGKFFTKVY
ncbi:hypothetical protein O6H91_06G054300 [Diphasiastrum complanatum]|nr:hypothetical protein O6H91_06G054300 [Diphasiastrum complanatum]